VWKIRRGQSANLPVNSVAAKAPNIAAGLTSTEKNQIRLLCPEAPSAEPSPAFVRQVAFMPEGKAAGVPKSNADGVHVFKTQHEIENGIEYSPLKKREIPRVERIQHAGKHVAAQRHPFPERVNKAERIVVGNDSRTNQSITLQTGWLVTSN
jgi:hypothetical protein